MNDMEILDLTDKTVFKNCKRDDWSAYELPRPVFVVCIVQAAQEKTNNGGFQYFFESNWPDNPPYSIFIEAFKEIGAEETADCFERATKLFPFENPHLSDEKRLAYLEEVGAHELDNDSEISRLGDRVMELNDDTYAKLAQYILKHKSYFPALEKRLAST